MDHRNGRRSRWGLTCVGCALLALWAGPTKAAPLARVDVSEPPYAASCDKPPQENHAALQAAFDANPAADIVFSGDCDYRVAGELILTDSTRRFSGAVVFAGGARVVFVQVGERTAPDSQLTAGFRMTARKQGEEQSGPVGVRFVNPRIVGPANGAAIYAANGQSLDISGGRIGGEKGIVPRYGIVGENMIRVSVRNSVISQFTNAGVAMLSTGARNVYAAGAYFNDSWTIADNVFGSDQPGSLAAILDHGSASFPTRIIEGNAVEGAPSRKTLQYGYVTRTGSPSLRKNWFENVPYPVKFITATEKGDLPGVTGAQPAGAYGAENFPGGYSYGAVLEDNETNAATVAFDVSGVNGVIEMIDNRSQGQAPDSIMIMSRASGRHFVVDKANTLVGPGVRLRSDYGQFVTFGDLGVMTFGKSPQAPTPASGANSTAVATTGYVDRLFAASKREPVGAKLWCGKSVRSGSRVDGFYRRTPGGASIALTVETQGGEACPAGQRVRLGPLPFVARSATVLTGVDNATGKAVTMSIAAGEDSGVLAAFDGGPPTADGHGRITISGEIDASSPQ